MLSFVEIEGDKNVGIRIDGKITAQEFDAVAALLNKRMENNPKVSLYAELKSFKGFSAEAFFKDLKFGLSYMNRFEKEPVVTDKKWMQKVSNIGGKIIDSVEVKAFSFDEKEEAKNWIIGE